MENLREKLKRLERLSLDPFKPEPLREELLSFLQRLEKRVEENHRICFGWIEEVFKRGFRRQV